MRVFGYGTSKQLARQRVFRFGTCAAVIGAILLGVVGLTSAANAMLRPAGQGYHLVKLTGGVALRDQQAACVWCGRTAHDCLDDLVVATSSPGDVLEAAELGLTVLPDLRGLALMERTFAPPPRLAASFKPRGPPFPV